MTTVSELLARQQVERMQEILSASPRKFREEVFRRLGIKAKNAGGGGFRLSAKSESRAQRFQEILVSDRGVPEELLSEIVRNFLYTRRGLLGDALDFFEVEHRDGLTDAELEFLSEVSEEKAIAAERQLLSVGHHEDDVELYLRFMGIKR